MTKAKSKRTQKTKLQTLRYPPQTAVIREKRTKLIGGGGAPPAGGIQLKRKNENGNRQKVSILR